MARTNLTLGERVLLVRRRLGYTQARLATVKGESELTVLRMEMDVRVAKATVGKFRMIESRYKARQTEPGTGRGWRRQPGRNKGWRR